MGYAYGGERWRPSVRLDKDLDNAGTRFPSLSMPL
jgi:hypothetical protein